MLHESPRFSSSSGYETTIHVAPSTSRGACPECNFPLPLLFLYYLLVVVQICHRLVRQRGSDFLIVLSNIPASLSFLSKVNSFLNVSIPPITNSISHPIGPPHSPPDGLHSLMPHVFQQIESSHTFTCCNCKLIACDTIHAIVLSLQPVLCWVK